MKNLTCSYLIRITRVMLVLLTFSHVSSVKSQPIDPPGIPDGWTDGFAYANGVRLHYYHAVANPDKPVMVMVHGITDNGLCWTTLTLKLQEDYDIYMLDARGHGLSDPFTTSDDGNTLVKDVVSFVEVMDFENPILMGHSMGAATVMRLGAEYPDLAEAIIMLDPFIGPRTPRRPNNKDEESDESNNEAPQKETLSVSMFGSPEKLVEQNNYSYEELVETCKINTPKWGLTDCHYWALSKKQYHGAYSSEAWSVMSGTMRTGESLSKIPVPALILKADASKEQRKLQQEAASVMQKGKLVHIDNAGHNLHHDELEVTYKEITSFLASYNSK